jgi:hypothetical protein
MPGERSSRRERRHPRLRLVVWATLLGAVLQTTSAAAWACGVSAPDGVSACSLEEHAEAVRPRWRVESSALFTSTALRFSSSLRGDESRRALLASLSYAPSRQVTLHGALGATLGGELDMPAAQYRLSAGPIGALGASWRAFERGRAFGALTAMLSVSSTATRLAGTTDATVRYTAFDLRLGAVAGATFFDRLSPYALGRVFGGPVFWHYQGAAVTGTDTHHYQLGAGVAFLLARRLDFYAEGVPLGERALSVGASFAF